MNLMNPMSFLPLPAVLPEDPKSAGFVVNLMKFERNGSLSAKGAEGQGIRVEHVRRQLTGLANCLQLP